MERVLGKVYVYYETDRIRKKRFSKCKWLKHTLNPGLQMIQHAPTLKKRAIKRSFTANLRKNSSVVPASGGRHSEGADRSLAVNFEKKPVAENGGRLLSASVSPSP